MNILDEIKQTKELKLKQWIIENFHADKTINEVKYYSVEAISDIIVAYRKDIEKMFQQFDFWEDNIPSWNDIKDNIETNR